MRVLSSLPPGFALTGCFNHRPPRWLRGSWVALGPGDLDRLAVTHGSYKDKTAHKESTPLRKLARSASHRKALKRSAPSLCSCRCFARVTARLSPGLSVCHRVCLNIIVISARLARHHPVQQTSSSTLVKPPILIQITNLNILIG